MRTSQVYNSLDYSVTRKLFTVIFNLYVVLCTIVFILFSYITIVSVRLDLEESRQHLAESVKTNLSNALINHKTSTVVNILRSINDHRAVSGVRLDAPITGEPYIQYGTVIQDTTGSYVYINPDLGTVSNSWVFNWGGNSVISVPLFTIAPNDSNIDLGTLKIFSNNKETLAAALLPILFMFLSLVVLIVGLWVLFVYYGYQLISKPLAELINTIQKIVSGEVDVAKVQVEIDGAYGTDIEVLQSSFNTMMGKLNRSDFQLERTRNRLDAIINAMPAVLIGVGRDGRITDWNSQAERWTGLPKAEAYGLTLDRANARLERYIVQVDDAIREEKVKHNHKVIEHQDDEIIYYDVTIYPVVQQKFAGAVLIINDITAQIKMEEIIVQTEKMSSVGGLAAGVAHEINNPLGIILQNSQNITRRLDPSLPANQTVAQQLNIDINVLQQYLAERKIPEFIDNIQKAGERAAGIVSNLLSFSRQAKSDKVDANVAEIVERALELVRADYHVGQQLDFKAIEIIREYAEDNITAYVCITEIEQVILNLFKNASQAMYTAGIAKPKIIIRIKRAEPELVSLEIEDNGPGMSEKVRKRIFEPFFTTKPVGEGTGLGLSVSYNLITENNGGVMRVDTIEGRGTKFTILLPNKPVGADSHVGPVA